jgi:SurA N-terminal domain
MIEHMRKYTGLIFVVIVLLFIGLAFSDRTASRGSATDPIAITVEGKSYTLTEYRKLGAISQDLATKLGLYELVSNLGTFGAESESDRDRFFINRLNLREAAEEYGVRPDDEAVKKAVMEVPAFKKQDGGFNQELYNEVVNKRLGSYGMTEKDLMDLVRDDLTMKKLIGVIGSGLSSSREQVEQLIARRDQKITVQYSKIDLAKAKAALNPTEEELKAEWNNTQDKYQTDKRIKVSWVVASPSYPEAPKAEELPANATDEQKKAAADKKTAAEATYAEQKRKAKNVIGEKIDEFVTELRDNKGADFDKLATKYGLDTRSSDSFSESAPPESLAGMIQAGTGSRSIASALFSINKTSDPLSSFTDPLPVGDGQWLVARLDEVIEPRNKTFEEARDQVRSDFVEHKAQEALKKETDEKVAKIKEALAASKSFADAAKELGLTVTHLGPFGMSDEQKDHPESQQIFTVASKVDPGALAETIDVADGKLLVFVEKRELVKDASRSSKIDSSVNALNSNLQRMAFSAWLDQKLKNTEIKKPQH